MSGRLIGIARREKVRTPMEELSRAHIVLDRGVQGDARGAVKDRNVTLIFRDGWQAACAALGHDLPWTARRANLYVEGLTGFKRVGARIKIGGVLLEVTEENPPCRVMDMQSPGLRAALEPDWRGGIACKVLTPGDVALGDPVVVVE